MFQLMNTAQGLSNDAHSVLRTAPIGICVDDMRLDPLLGGQDLIWSRRQGILGD